MSPCGVRSIGSLTVFMQKLSSVQLLLVGFRPSTVNVMLKEIHYSWLIQKTISEFLFYSLFPSPNITNDCCPSLRR